MAAPASRVELYNDSASPIRTACVLALVKQTAAPDSPPYPFRSNEQSHAIVEIRSVEVQIEGSEHTARFLDDVFGFRANGRDGSVFRFKDRTSTSTVAIDLLCAPNSEPGTAGPGVAHQVAWRVADERALHRICVQRSPTAAMTSHRRWIATTIKQPIFRHRAACASRSQPRSPA